MTAARKAYSVFAIAAVFAIPALCIVFGSLSLVHAGQIDQHGVTTRAYVQDNITSRSGNCESADVSYTTVSGTDESGRVDTDGCLTVGSLVTVIYDPSAPNVVVLKDKAGGPTGDAGSTLWTGLVLLALEGLAFAWALVKKIRQGSTLTEHIVDRRSPVGLAAALALAAGGLFACTYYVLGSGSPDGVGFVFGVLAILPLGYLAVPRVEDKSSRAGRWTRGIAWCCCGAIVLVGTPTVRDVWMRAVGRPQQGTITHVEVVHDRDDTSRNYTVQLADGRVLPLGDISSDEVGRHAVGDRVTVDVDPHGLFDPEAAGGLPIGFDLIAPGLILLLVLGNAGIAVLRRDDGDEDGDEDGDDGRHSESSRVALTAS